MLGNNRPLIIIELVAIALIWSAFAITYRAVASPPGATGSLLPVSPRPGGTVGTPAVSDAAPGFAQFGATGSPLPVSPPPPDPALIRAAKCRAIWQSVAPWSYSAGLADYFCLQHELAGIPDQWYWSLVYGYSNFGLTIRSRAPGRCYGPLDVKWPGFARRVGARKPDDLLDPELNIRAHVAEMAYYHRRTGRTGLPLLATVFYPAAPREYHRWRPTDRRFRQVLSTWYRKQAASPATRLPSRL